MSEEQWPTDWPNPDTLKSAPPITKKPSSDAMRHVQTAVWGVGGALVVAAVFVLLGGLGEWLRPIPSPIPTRSPIVHVTRPALPPATAESCTLHMETGLHNCQAFIRAGALTVESHRANRTLLKLTLDPFETGYNAADFAITFNDAPLGWAVNIGDAAQNDGHGTGSTRATHDAEIALYNGDLTLYGNDNAPARPLWSAADFAAEGETIHLLVRNQAMGWVAGNGESSYIEDNNLFALARQPDEQGSPNYDIYAAFNRTIAYDDEAGAGVDTVTITFEK